jgi:hypothetical protein
MPRINTESRLIPAMRELQLIFIAQQNNDVSVSRAKFNDWADSWGNKTLLFQSLYSKGIPIAELAKWLSPTQNQGQVRNAVVKINDISYVQSVIGANRTIEDFKKILVYSTTENNTSMINSIASGYTNAIRYWWDRQGGNQQRVVRQPRTTTPSEPTTTNGGTIEITEGVLNSCYQIIKLFHGSIQHWIGNQVLSLSPSALAEAWRNILTDRLLSPRYNLLQNPPLISSNQDLLFWRSQNDETKFLLQQFSLLTLFDYNSFTRALTFKLSGGNETTIQKIKNRFGNQNTPQLLMIALERKQQNFKDKVQFTSTEKGYLQRVYLGASSYNAEPLLRENATTQPTETLQQQDTASSTLVRNIPFTNTFGLEIEYFYTPISKLISEGKKFGVKIADMGYTHNVTSDWKIVTDGSVSGTNARELVSPILRGKKGLVEMRKCLNAMANAGALVNESCGLHLHFGAKDLSLQTWKNLLLNYDGFQSTIDKLLASYRRGNNRWSKNLSSVTGFRQKVKAATSFRDLQLIFLEANGVNTGQGTDYEYRSSARYYAVNLMPYAKHGTIEFRQHGANIEVDTVTAWVLFMHYLVEVSKKKELTNYTFENIQNFTPVALSTFLANRIFELSEPNRNAVTQSSRYEDRS